MNTNSEYLYIRDRNTNEVITIISTNRMEEYYDRLFKDAINKKSKLSDYYTISRGLCPDLNIYTSTDEFQTRAKESIAFGSHKGMATAAPSEGVSLGSCF